MAWYYYRITDVIGEKPSANRKRRLCLARAALAPTISSMP